VQKQSLQKLSTVTPEALSLWPRVGEGERERGRQVAWEEDRGVLQGKQGACLVVF
jgi:hypothetical protein